jgi:hypothetical protein
MKSNKAGRIVRNVVLALVVIGLIWWGISSIKSPNSAKAGDIPKVEDPVTNPTSTPEDPKYPDGAVFNPSDYDGVWNYDGRDGHHSFFIQVRQPGDTATFAIFCEVECLGIDRLVPDDELVRAYVVLPNGEQRELSFEFVNVPAGGTGDPFLDAQLASRGVNIEEGEILPQSKDPVTTNAPAGSIIILNVVDTKDVNVGAFTQIKN